MIKIAEITTENNKVVEISILYRDDYKYGVVLSNGEDSGINPEHDVLDLIYAIESAWGNDCLAFRWILTDEELVDYIRKEHDATVIMPNNL